jgi:hypothetical protein
MSWRRIKIFFGRLGTYLYLSLGIYGLWSRLYRAVAEWRYRNLEISTYDSYESLVAAVRKLIWKADSWEQLWDAVSLPQRVEYVLNWQADKRVGDCDEFAIYQVAALNKSLKTGKFIGDFDLEWAAMLTVTWVDKDGKYGGHNVCLLVKDLEYSSGYAYMDYGMPSKTRNTIREVVIDVLNRYAPAGDLLIWGVSDENLHPLLVGR